MPPPHLLLSLFLFSASTACGSRTGLVIPTDGGAFPSGPDECPNSGSTFVYVISEQNELLSFYPPTTSFTSTVTPVAPFSPPTLQPELTGTGAGKLYGFYATTAVDSAIAQVDVNTAQLTSTVGLPGVTQVATTPYRTIVGAGVSTCAPQM